jgi:hypothetical protein
LQQQQQQNAYDAKFRQPKCKIKPKAARTTFGNLLTPWLVGYCNNMEMETGKSHELKKNQNTFSSLKRRNFTKISLFSQENT